MTGPPASLIPPLRDRLVAEPDGTLVDAHYDWIEIPLRQTPEAIAAQAAALREQCPGARFVGATMGDGPGSVVADVRKGLEAGLECLLFEATRDVPTAELMDEICGSERLAVPTIHLLDACEDRGRLADELLRLESYGGWCAKLAYPAMTARAVAAGLDVLTTRALAGATVSVTPMGTTWGRLAAAVAGSALVFAPVFGGEPGRPTARRLLSLAAQLEP